MRSPTTFGVIVAGVGGQGAITIAQLILAAAWMGGLHAMQSEVHGMSQRGGEVNAQVLFSNAGIRSPIIEAGTADLLIGLEPLETLRHLHYLGQAGHTVTASEPLINMDAYPEPEKLLALLHKTPNVKLIDTKTFATELHFTQAGNMVLLGAATNFMPLDESVWTKAMRKRFHSKSDKIIEKNLAALRRGRELTA